MFGANGVAHPTSIHPHLAAIEASQRAISKVVGASHTTIQNDLSGNKLPHPQTKPSRNTPPEPPSGNKLPRPDSGRAAVQKLAEKDKRPRSGNATHDNDDEWYTPPKIIEAARSAMGGLAFETSRLRQREIV